MNAMDEPQPSHIRSLIARSIAASLTNSTCPPYDTAALDPSTGWQWDKHRIGWVAAGSASFVTTVIACLNIWLHARNYRRPLEQRQVIRILMMPPIFSIISFMGYRWYRQFIYFEVIRNTYEALCIAAFFALMLFFLAASPAEQRAALARKEKRKLVFPFCCFRYRPSKPYFLFTVKWSVLQFVIVKPLISIACIVTEAIGVYCSTSQSFRFANIYLEIVDFFCVSVALYGLIILYTLVHDELKGHRILSKFLTIKIVVALVFYQGFVFTLLERYKVIKATEYWTAQNVSDGLNALSITVEMVLVALLQLYAFPYTEYKDRASEDGSRGGYTSFWKSFFHSQNYSDFAIDIWCSLRFFLDRILGKAYTSSKTADNTDTFKGGSGSEFDMQHVLQGGSRPLTSRELAAAAKGKGPALILAPPAEYPPYPASASSDPSAGTVHHGPGGIAQGGGLSHAQGAIRGTQYKPLFDADSYETTSALSEPGAPAGHGRGPSGTYASGGY